jgi:hypothetical protein
MSSINNGIDPMMPFSVDFGRITLPDGNVVNPVIFFGSQGKGFFGNIRYVKARSTRIFFFEISLSGNETNFPSYYTIIVVIPGGFTKDPSMPNYEKVFQTIEICKRFQKINKKFTGECMQEANRFANLAVQHVDSQNSMPGAWGAEIGSDEPVMMAVVLGQFDFGHEVRTMASFPVGEIDFNPPSAAASAAPPAAASAKSAAKRKRGGKRRKGTKRRISKRKGSKRRKTIRRK